MRTGVVRKRVSSLPNLGHAEYSQLIRDCTAHRPPKGTTRRTGNHTCARRRPRHLTELGDTSPFLLLSFIISCFCSLLLFSSSFIFIPCDITMELVWVWKETNVRTVVAESPVDGAESHAPLKLESAEVSGVFFARCRA